MSSPIGSKNRGGPLPDLSSSPLPAILEQAELFAEIAGSYDARALFAKRNGGQMWQVFHGGTVVGPMSEMSMLLNAADSWGVVYGLLSALSTMGDKEALVSTMSRLSDERTMFAAKDLELAGGGLCAWVGKDPTAAVAEAA